MKGIFKRFTVLLAVVFIAVLCPKFYGIQSAVFADEGYTTEEIEFEAHNGECRTYNCYRIGGISYDLNEESNEATVIRLYPDGGDEYAIPSTISINEKEYTVVAIGESVVNVEDRETVKKVIIPDSVTSIGYGAFEKCGNLTSIEIPNTVTYIEGAMFIDCAKLPGVTLPNGLTEIGVDTFRNCEELTSIEIPASVTKIGKNAFENCKKITSIRIPDGVEEIEPETFIDCSKLTSVIIPDSVEWISRKAFKNCGMLTSIVIPKSVRNMQEEVFLSCSRLETIYIESEEQRSQIKEWTGFDDSHIELHAHEGGSPTCTTRATCTSTYCGMTYLEPHDYESEWKKDSTGHWHKCKYCDATTTKVSHEGGSATCVAKAVCTACGESYGELGDHDYESEWKKDSTGHWHKCKYCDVTTTKVSHEGGSATCVAKAVCTACGESYGELGDHDYESEWKKDSTGHWHKCKYCDVTTTEESHDYDEGKVTTAATYSAAGEKTYKCKNCEATKTEAIDKLVCTEHSYDDGKVTKEATYEAEGEKTYTCKNCGATKTEAIDKLTKTETPEKDVCTEHSYDDGKVTKEATYEAEGEKTYTCKNCGATKTEAIDKLTKTETPEKDVCTEHSYDEGKVTKKATYTAAGQKTYTCKNCGDVKTESIAKKTLSQPVISKVENSSAVKLTWKKVSGAAGYIIYRREGTGSYKKLTTISKASTVTYTDTSAKTNGAKYQYKIKAYVKEGSKTVSSKYSAEETIYFLSKGKVTSAKNSASKTALIKWSKNEKATGYEIQYTTASSFDNAKTVKVKKASTLSKTLKSLTKGKTYRVRVRSYKTSGKNTYYSAWSSVSKVKIAK